MAKPKNPSNEKKIQTLLGRKPNSVRARIAQITKLVHMYGLDSRKYHDDHWQAINDYETVITSLGCDFSCWCENGGYTDRDPQDGMPRSKVYNVMITYPDGMVIGGYIKAMAAGSVSDPFDAYDTCIILWPKTKNELKENMVKQLSESKMKTIIKEAVNKILRESLPEFENVAVFDVLNDDFDNDWRSVLTANLYNDKNEFVGKLTDMHFVYDVENNKLEGSD